MLFKKPDNKSKIKGVKERFNVLIVMFFSN